MLCFILGLIVMGKVLCHQSDGASTSKYKKLRLNVLMCTGEIIGRVFTVLEITQLKKMNTPVSVIHFCGFTVL